MYDYRNILPNVFQTKRKIRFCVTISVTQKNPSLGILLWWSMRSVAICRLPWGEIRIEIFKTYEYSTALPCQRLHVNSAVGRRIPRCLLFRRFPRLEDGSSITGYVGMVRHSYVPGFPHHTKAFGKRYEPTQPCGYRLSLSRVRCPTCTRSHSSELMTNQ